jgi:hypothetical protein
VKLAAKIFPNLELADFKTASFRYLVRFVMIVFFVAVFSYTTLKDKNPMDIVIEIWLDVY